MKKIIVFIIFFITCVVAQIATAQVSVFNKTYDDFGGWEIASKSHTTKNGNILTISSTIDFFALDSTNNRRLFSSLLDKNGILLKKQLITFPLCEHLSTNDFTLINDTLFTVSLFRNNTGKLFSVGIYLNDYGDTLKTIPIAHYSFPNAFPSITAIGNSSTNNFITTYRYRSAYGDSIYITSSDNKGNILWVKEFKDLHVSITKIIETPDKGFILSGYEFGSDKYKTSADGLELIYIGHPERLWYAKIDSIGNMEWQKKLSGSGYDLLDTIYYKYKLSNQTQLLDGIQTNDGNYVLAGMHETNPYLTKINNSGNKVWERRYFTHYTYMDTNSRKAGFVEISEKENNLYALGFMDSLEMGSEYTKKYYFLIKMTSTGKPIWTRYIPLGQSDYLYSLNINSEGFILTGSKHDTIPKYGSQDSWIIKLDSNGCLQANCNLFDVIDTTTALPFELLENNITKITLYPNPSTGIFTIQGIEPNTDAQISIYDVQGKEITNALISNTTIDLSNQPNGLYYLKIKDKSGNVLLKQPLVIAR